VKYHNLELGTNLMQAMEVKNPAADKMLADYSSQLKKYADQSAKIQAEAQHDDEEAEADEGRGLKYDVGEGLLEIALVLTSLYFISRKLMFPVIGVLAGIAGLAVSLVGLVSSAAAG
jgi:hypothetical protein